MGIIKEIKEMRTWNPSEYGGEFHWCSCYTGEVQRNLKDVIKESITAFRNWDHWGLRENALYIAGWKHSRKGFC